MKQRSSLGKTWLLAGLVLVVLLAVALQGGQPVEAQPNIGVLADWFVDSNQTDGDLGRVVDSAGDVNGDGYDDLLVGSQFYDSNGVIDSGRAWVYYGGPNGPSTTADWSITPPYLNAYGFWGMAVAGLGDVNGDKFDDIAVGLPNYESNGSLADEGAVYVFYGSKDGLSTSPDWMARGDHYYAHFGLSVGAAGDVNGDTFNDLIVGAYMYAPTNQVSHAYVFHGSADGFDPGGGRPVGLPGNADWLADGSKPAIPDGDAFGYHVGTAGDVNDDGFDDVWVGAPNYSDGQSLEGAVFVWYGSDTGLGANSTPAGADWQAVSNQENAKMRRAAAVGDLDGDNYDDLIVGAPGYTAHSAAGGGAFVYLGGESGLNEGVDGTPDNADWMTYSDQAGASVGWSLAEASDMNGDGRLETVLGAYGWDGSETNEGALWVYIGEDGPPDVEPDRVFVRPQEGGYFGFEVAAAGDVNGDGLDDLIVGTPYYDNGQVNEGCAFLIYGRITVYLPTLVKPPAP